MYVWILNIFTRDDEFCESDASVLAAYSEENFEEAWEHFQRLCDANTLEEDGRDDIEWKNDNGYHFSSEVETSKGYKYRYVGLKKVDVN